MNPNETITKEMDGSSDDLDRETFTQAISPLDSKLLYHLVSLTCLMKIHILNKKKNTSSWFFVNKTFAIQIHTL